MGGVQSRGDGLLLVGPTVVRSWVFPPGTSITWARRRAQIVCRLLLGRADTAAYQRQVAGTAMIPSSCHPDSLAESCFVGWTPGPGGTFYRGNLKGKKYLYILLYTIKLYAYFNFVFFRGTCIT